MKNVFPFLAFFRSAWSSTLTLCFLLLLFTATSHAAQINLVWNANTELQLGGYKLHYGQASKSYTSSIDVGNKTAHTISGLQDGKTYYFAVTAYNLTKTAESSFSNEVSATTPAAPTSGPVANFTVNKTSGLAPLAVLFTDTSTGDITNWLWNFGDGSSTTAQIPVHTYSSPGTYTVSLTVTGPGGSNTSTKINYISATWPSPVASFMASATSGAAPLAVSFTDASTGNITSWRWDFGDGNTSTAKHPSHTYTAAGTYTVRETVTGPGGSASKTITITALGSGSEAGVSPGLVAAYSFSTGAGSTLFDVSGKGNHGAISGASWRTKGRFDKALYFNGTDSWVTVNDAPSLDLTNGMTLEAWIYPTVAMTGWRTVLMKEQPSIYYLSANSNANRPATGVYVAGSSILNGVSTVPANQWTHLAATHDGATLRLFVNGTQVANIAQPGPITTSNEPLRIGGNSLWGEYFQGYIDEVRIYNRALAASQILEDMREPVRCPCSIWDNGAKPMIVAETDNSPVELGIKFKSNVAGYITGIRFYKSATNTGTHTGTLWSNTGQRLATATFINETASGWQEVKFAAPVPITANTVYIASYHTDVGHYSVDPWYFATKGADNPPLHALQEGVSGSNGVYRYGTSDFPTNTWQSANYWVDVVFSTR